MKIELGHLSPVHVDSVFALLTGAGERTPHIAAVPEDLAAFAPPQSMLSVVALADGEVVGAALSTADGQLRCIVTDPADPDRRQVMLGMAQFWEDNARFSGVVLQDSPEVVPKLGAACSRAE